MKPPKKTPGTLSENAQASRGKAAADRAVEPGKGLDHHTPLLRSPKGWNARMPRNPRYA